jgi:hypothetical protein
MWRATSVNILNTNRSFIRGKSRARCRVSLKRLNICSLTAQWRWLNNRPSGSGARRVATLKAHDKQKVRLIRRSNFITLVMLGLLAHAQLVAAIHHHSIPTFLTTTVTTEAEGQSRQGLESNSDWQCQLCQLQRAFSSSAPAPSFFVELVAPPVNGEAFLAIPHTRGPTRVPSDRAPPLA